LSPRTASAQRWYVTLDGQRVRELRIGRGLAQERVCQQAGISTRRSAASKPSAGQHAAAGQRP
jgi:hypothetical protein